MFLMKNLFDTAGVELGKTGPDYSAELAMVAEHGGLVCGVDEVGRGPLAGPVVAAAVILDPDNIPEGLNDSKKLSAKKRAILFEKIMATALAVSVAEALVEEIDAINILQASMLAMRRAVKNLPQNAQSALVDGNCDPKLDLPTICLIKGDARSFSIAAASIIAKKIRDEKMANLAKIYPDYGWEKNAGYGVPAHIKSLELVGITPYHRKTFAPVLKILNEDSDTSY